MEQRFAFGLSRFADRTRPGRTASVSAAGPAALQRTIGKGMIGIAKRKTRNVKRETP
jgi:hypothetical protein